jgi:hypothetical protein
MLSLVIKDTCPVGDDLALVLSTALLIIAIKIVITSKRSLLRWWHLDVARSRMSCIKPETARSLGSITIKSTAVRITRRQPRGLPPWILRLVNFAPKALHKLAQATRAVRASPLPWVEEVSAYRFSTWGMHQP